MGIAAEPWRTLHDDASARPRVAGSLPSGPADEASRWLVAGPARRASAAPRCVGGRAAGAAFPPGPDAITAAGPLAAARTLLGARRSSPARPGHGLRAGDRDGGRAAAPRPPLLPADARGHRGRARTTSTCSSTATSRATSGRRSRRAGREGRRRRRGPPRGRRDRQRGRLREQGALPPAARGRHRGRRPRRRLRGPRSGALGARHVRAARSRTCSTSIIARWSSSTARIGYVGGSGIEDHYNDERFYDVMCRVDRADRRPAPARSSWRAGGTTAARAPDDRRASTATSRRRPSSSRPMRRSGAPTTVLWNVPGHRPPPDQRRHRAGARRRRGRGSTSSTRTSRTGRSSSGSSRRPCAASRSA